MKNKEKISWFTGRTSNILFSLFVIGYALSLKSGDGEFYYHWGVSIPRSTWILWFIFGICLLILGLVRREKSTESYSHTFICTECLIPLKPEELVKNVCPKCECKVENVKEFYKKNPNFMKREI